jgi:hypothetical protein
LVLLAAWAVARPWPAFACDLPEAALYPLQLSDAGSQPALAWTGTEYGAAWIDDGYGANEIQFVRIDASGNQIGDVVRLTSLGTATAHDIHPLSLVWAGTGYGIAWADERDGDREIYFSRLDAMGNPLGAIQQVTSDTFLSSGPSLVWTGTEYAVAWSNGWMVIGPFDSGISIYFARIDAAGNKIGFDRVVRHGYLCWRPSLVWTGSEYGVAWYEERVVGDWDIYFGRVDAAGNNIGLSTRVTSEPSDASFPSLVWNGNEYAVAWHDSRHTEREIYFVRIDAAGTKIGSDMRVTSSTETSESPSLVWRDTEYGVSWADRRNGTDDVYFARIDVSGNKVGPDVRVTSVEPALAIDPALVWTGGEYGVVYWEFPESNVRFSRIGCDCIDGDSDGVSVCNDCDDGDASAFPDASEICDGSINDCRHPNWPGPDDVDADTDGFTICHGDCNDSRDTVFPEAQEICDGIGNDCDDPDWPAVPPNEMDQDRDSFWICEGDCNDADRSISPAGVETCNAVDDDCNRLVDDDTLGEDTDRDRVHNLCDNCRVDPNLGQSDLDTDGDGDACDVDDGLIYIVFRQKGFVEWQAESGFSSWNSYRGDLAVLQRDGPLAYTQDPARVPLATRNCDLAVPLVADTDPPPDTAVFFLTTGNHSGTGIEGSLGVDSSGAERFNRFPCP